METREHGIAIAVQQERGGIGHGTDVMSEIASCSEELRALCGDYARRWSDAEDSDGETDTHSAAEIASECLALLESLSVGGGDDTDGEGGGDAESTALSPVRSQSSEIALLREINDLGSELEALMTALSSSAHQDHSAAADIVTAESNHALNEEPGSVCTSPKMAALTRRLEQRPTTQRMLVHTALRRHKSFPLGLQSHLSSLRRKSRSDSGRAQTTKSATRELLSDAAFWRQYQSKSFQRHLTRQSQARAIQQREKENENKAIEYRYRRVPKPCYPLAKTRIQRGLNDKVATPAEIAQDRVSSEQRKKSYAKRFQTSSSDAEEDDAPRESGLLCGVYLHGKRRSHGMLYLTCTSLDQLKMRVANKFSLAQPVVNLYREQVATDSRGTRQRKYLHRVVRFDELRDGDLLCATTDGYDDMAILCAWMKKRQQLIHNYKSPPTSQDSQPTKTETTYPPEPVSKMERKDTLTYKKPPPPPQVKLWDENGRLVSISHKLPLDE